jgi:hypothetical protein
MRLLLKLLAIPGLVGAWSFLSGALAYLNGTAAFMAVGRPGPEFWNLDPDYRVYRQTSGCIVLGTELVTHVPNNVAIVVMTGLLGPMRGTYHGPYPTPEQARAALRRSSDVADIEALRSFHHPIHDCAALRAEYPPRAGLPALSCAVFEDSTIVLGAGGEAVLFDSQTGTRYARYRVQ